MDRWVVKGVSGRRERSVQDRGFVWRFIGPRRPDPGRFGFSGECRPKEAVGSGSRTGWEGGAAWDQKAISDLLISGILR